jgi:hypothetical protein
LKVNGHPSSADIKALFLSRVQGNRAKGDEGKGQETQPNKVNIAIRKMLFMFNEGMKKREHKLN